MYTPSYWGPGAPKRFSYDDHYKAAGYDSEIWLELKEKNKTAVWGHFILPMSGGAPAYLPNPKLIMPSNSINSGTGTANNMLQSESALATYKFDYKTPIAYYTDSTGVRYFYFMSYLDKTTSLTATAVSACPARTVKDMGLRNCWDAGIVPHGYKEFFGTGLRTNFALWTAVCWMLIFFVWTNGAENDTKIDDRFRENYWTLHPVYSCYQFGSETYTKTSRLCLWVTTIGIQQFLVSIFFYNSVNNTKVSLLFYTIAGGFISWAVSIPLTYLLAIPLQYVYGAHNEYARLYRGNKDVKYRDFITDQYALKKIRLYFIFYFMMLCVSVGVFTASIALIQDLERNDMWHWLASAGGAWAFDMFFADVFIVFLGGTGMLKFLRLRGYYIDYDVDVKMRSLDME